MMEQAKENDMFVRAGVTNNLGLLVCGDNAGWAKLKKASELGVAKVYGEVSFSNFLETGEIAE